MNENDWRLITNEQGSNDKQPIQLVVNNSYDQIEVPDYRALLYKYFFSKWYLYVLFVPICLAAAHMGAKIIEPTYLIHSKLLIQEIKSEFSATEDWLKKSMNFSSVSENVANEIQVLSSYSLMSNVVEELGLDTKYQWKEGLIEREGYRDFPILVDTFNVHPNYMYAPLSIVPISDSLFEFHTDSLIGTYRFGDLFSNLAGTYRVHSVGPLFLDSDSIMQVIFMHPNAVTEGYLRGLGVGLVDKKSTMLALTLEDPVPQKGVDIMSALIAEYARLKEEENTALIGNTLSLINERLKDVSRNLSSVESSVEKFKLSNNYSGESNADLNLVLQEASSLSADQKGLEVQLAILEALAQNLEEDDGAYNLISASLSFMGVEVTNQVKIYNQLVLERGQLLKSAGASNPVLIASTEKLSDLKMAIKRTIGGKKEEVGITLASTESQYQASMDKIKSVPTINRVLATKEREHSIVENLYVYLLQRREEATLAQINSSKNFKLIDAPRSSLAPVGPNIMMLYLGGMVAGMGIPFVFVFLMYFFKDPLPSNQTADAVAPPNAEMSALGAVEPRQMLASNGQSEGPFTEFQSLGVGEDFIRQDDNPCIIVTPKIEERSRSYNRENDRNRTVILDSHIPDEDEDIYS